MFPSCKYLFSISKIQSCHVDNELFSKLLWKHFQFYKIAINNEGLFSSDGTSQAKCSFVSQQRTPQEQVGESLPKRLPPCVYVFKELKKEVKSNKALLDSLNEVSIALLELVPWRAREGLEKMVAEDNERYRLVSDTITQKVEEIDAAILRSQQVGQVSCCLGHRCSPTARGLYLDRHVYCCFSILISVLEKRTRGF